MGMVAQMRVGILSSGLWPVGGPCWSRGRPVKKCGRKKLLGIQSQLPELPNTSSEEFRWPSFSYCKYWGSCDKEEGKRGVWFKLSLGQGEEKVLSVCTHFSLHIT